MSISPAATKPSLLSPRLKGDLIMLLVAAVWGSGFVAQGLVARSELDAFYFNGARFLLASLVIFVLGGFKWRLTRAQLPGIFILGVVLFAASWLQQIGLATTTVGNAAFITGLYVVLVPLLLALFWREQVGWTVWTAALIAALGVFLLSVRGGFRFVPGDLIELAGALGWALHIILIGRLTKGMDALGLAAGQFMVCGLLSMLAGFINSPNGLGAFPPNLWAVAYSGLFPVATGLTLQAVGQKFAPTADAAIILSMEAVFGAFFGYLFLRELLTPLQLLGCVLILGAIVLAQVKPDKKNGHLKI